MKLRRLAGVLIFASLCGALLLRQKSTPVPHDDSSGDKLADRRPRLLSQPPASHSSEASRACVNSSVRIQGTVNEQGRLVDVAVVRSAGFGLDSQALEAAGSWRFEPAIRDGRLTPIRFAATVPFTTLDPSRCPTASLTFDLPTAASRPELVQGTLADIGLPQSVVTTVTFQVDRRGTPIEVSGGTGSIRDRVRAWRFTPSTLDGRAIDVPAVLTLYRNKFD